ncbi:hypothetical protein PHYBOEH_006109 [Phytophthora boehmeriae]|uniref:Uncharacterized protein n=1 Tax=Phytophthora boehmeriae TaxID=109152 RepID=A0A8T1X283_9STRA|nr:hypothetical protein PHYBOEH_006109 [Phytophthora boehmeriae]
MPTNAPERWRSKPSESNDVSRFDFDGDKLIALQENLPTDLQLLRLRLRFGLPARIQVGQKFRGVVDLVNEMGQSTVGLETPEDLEIALANDNNSAFGVDQLALSVEKKTPTARTKQQQAKWVFWATVRSSSSSQPAAVDPNEVNVSLRIQMKQPRQTLDKLKEFDSPRRLLQQLCEGSAWLNDQVLVLPLQVELQVANARTSDDDVSTSTVCQRLFQTSLVPDDRKQNQVEQKLLVIEENYGDAMGSHVWDASILLSFAMLQAGMTLPKFAEQSVSSGVPEGNQAMLELGSGCGLFATVLASLQSSFQYIFTEKPDSTKRLRANLLRNGSSSALVLPLEWGPSLPSGLQNSDVRVVFAADVLYNWAAHEALLATLDSLAQQQPLQVFLAHKRRGKASAENLNALASGTFNSPTDCKECRWQHWHVEKLARLGRIDLFRLDQRHL